MALTMTLHGGCGDKKDAASGKNKPDKPVGAAVDAKSTTTTTTETMTAIELHARYFRSPSPKKLFANKRVLVTGSVHMIRAARKFVFVFKGGPARQQVSCEFRDGGAAAKDKKLAKGSEATVDCKVRGRLAMRIELVDCVLK